MDLDYEIRHVTAYLSVYNVTRQFGGHEEGGWYYDAYEWMKMSIPFRAVQDYRYMHDRPHDDGHGWESYGPPRPADFQSEIQVAAHHYNLQTFFGPETNGRSSVLSDGDTVFIIELHPGERDERPRPRYE